MRKIRYGKKELTKKINSFAYDLANSLTNHTKDRFDLVIELCEILDRKPMEKIEKEVGSMSSNQWCNYLDLTLKGLHKIY